MKRRALVTFVSQPRPDMECRSWRVQSLPWPTRGEDVVELARVLDDERGTPVSFVSLAWPEPEPRARSSWWTLKSAAAVAVFVTWDLLVMWLTRR